MNLKTLAAALCLIASASAATIQFSSSRLYVHDDTGLLTALDSSSSSYFAALDSGNYGNFGWTFTNSGAIALSNVRLIAFLDADIDRSANTFFNEYGEIIGLALPPSALPGAIAPNAWEIDEPGFVFGDILNNAVAGILDNTNAVPSAAPDDVSLALLFAIGTLDPGQAATVRLFLSDTNIGGLRQEDPGSILGFYFNGFATVDSASSPQPPAEVPEPSAVGLLGLGGLLEFARRKFPGGVSRACHAPNSLLTVFRRGRQG